MIATMNKRCAHLPAEHCQLVLVMPNAMSEEHDTNTILATLLKKELDCCIFF